ncbi:DUF7344 domain-containing protein [Haloarcula marina]|uniref:DUF7344 domain-containing protein n=1 Tax=Haloarcula marina TaxID=2961574 RepID=UPI0020B63FC8|nr:hypothetical protein [Halomicroarcula marina]
MGAPTDPDWESIFHALSKPERRTTVNFLFDSDQPATFDAIAAHLDETGDESRTDVEVRLYHVTLPMLDRVDLVDWNRDGDTVSLTETAHRVPVGALNPSTLPQQVGVASTSDEQRADD